MQDQILSFRLEGRALQQHSIDLVAFAKSIQGLSRLLKATNQIAFGDTEISIELLGDIAGGSFSWRIKFNWKDFGDGPFVRLATICTLLGFGKQVTEELGLFQLLDRVPHEFSDCQICPMEDDTVEICIDGDIILTNSKVVQILTNKGARKGLDDFTSPLGKKGIDKLCVGRPGSESPVGHKKNRRKYERTFPLFLDSQEPSAQESVSEDYFEVVSANLTTDGKWRVKPLTGSYGSGKVLWAFVKDREFKRSVLSKRQRIMARDVIHARVTKRIDYDPLRHTRTSSIDIIEVIEYMHEAEFRNRQKYLD